MLETVSCTVKGIEYFIPKNVWDIALETFNQHYRPGVDVKSLCRQIGQCLMPESYKDRWSSERLARCLMSAKGKIGAAKRNMARKKKW